jgi:toxin ParE1/3/4
MRVLIRPGAYGDLERIFDWIAKDRPTSAHATVARILDSTERLAHFPHLGHDGQRPGTSEWAIPGLPYVVVYRVDIDNDFVDVIAVFHGAQNRNP